MASSNSCNQLLTANQIASCNGLKKVGGIDGTVYIGFRSDIATLTLGTDGEITTLTLASGKKLSKFGGNKEQHAVTWESVPMKGKAMFKHAANFFLYPYSQTDVKQLEFLISSERMFAIYVNLAGQVKAIGIDIDPIFATDFVSERGLKVTTAKYQEGVTYAADTWCEVPMEGVFWNAPKLYKPSASLAANITELDGFSFTV
jgi:hypothetical protein